MSLAADHTYPGELPEGPSYSEWAEIQALCQQRVHATLEQNVAFNRLYDKSVADCGDYFLIDGNNVESHIPFLMPVQESRHPCVDVGTGADHQKDNDEQALKVEDGRLRYKDMVDSSKVAN